MKPHLHALLLLIFCIVTTTWAVTPYAPVRPSPLSESWRWHAQEALDGYTLTDCFEGGDGTLWFVSDTGIVHYDGLEVTHYPAPDDLNLVAYRSGARTRDGSIYLLIPWNIIQFKSGRFEVIHNFKGNYDMLYGQAVLADEDTVLFGIPQGIVSVNDAKVELISTFNRRASYLLLDSRGDLWMNRVGSGLVFRYREFTVGSKLDDNRWENDMAADDYVPNDFGTEDSLVQV